MKAILKQLAGSRLAITAALLATMNLALAQPLQPEVLANFASDANAPANPLANLAQGNDGTFYGVTEYGGAFESGTVFRLTANGVRTTLISFDGTNNFCPTAGLTMGNDGNLYGTTYRGGAFGNGTVLRLTTNGALTTLVSLNVKSGTQPNARLISGSDGNLYGTTSGGGSHGYGTVFRITTNGALTSLVSFNSTNGSNPMTALVLGSDGNFYGTTEGGGSFGFGTVFRLTRNGTLTTLYSFKAITNGFIILNPNPSALALGCDGNLYGTTFSGGSGAGSVFRVTTNGDFTTLYSFTGFDDGGSPSTLTRGPDGNFYGTTWDGGIIYNTYNFYGAGTVFRITTEGILTTIYFFTPIFGDGYFATAGPSELTLGRDGNFYGATYNGGGGMGQNPLNWDWGAGTLFRLTTNGELTTLTDFTGDNPVAGLTFGSDGNLYGTTEGGSLGGVVYRATTNGVLTILASLADIGAPRPNALTLGIDGNFYGTSHGYLRPWGGIAPGCIFRVTTNGTLTKLYSFGTVTDTNGNNLDGYFPSTLTLGDDGCFYGTTARSGGGTVFRVTTNGTLTTLYSFGAITNADGNALDGWSPSALTRGNDGNFYGTTAWGGSNSAPFNAYRAGTVFRVTTNGTLTTLYSFGAVTDSDGNVLDGYYPIASLTLGTDGNLYGTTEYGGRFSYLGIPDYGGYGTAFRVTTNGVLTTLYSFGAIDGFYGSPSDGANPTTALTLGTDGNLYGTTGGTFGEGALFQLATNGTLTTLVSFDGVNEAFPYSPLTLGNDGNFYGTANGGAAGGGVIYRLRRSVSIQSSGMVTKGFQVDTLNVGGTGWVVLESSSDLRNWTPIQTNGTAAAQQFLDAVAAKRAQQFYRVRQR